MTAVMPDAIVLSADSAVVLPVAGLKDPSIYTGVNKVFHWHPEKTALSMFGSFPPGIENVPFDRWVSTWRVRNYEDAARVDIDDQLRLFCDDLQRRVDKSIKTPVGFHVATWVENSKEYPGVAVPVLFGVSRNDGQYGFRPLLGKKFLDRVYDYRKNGNPKSYGVEILIDGIANRSEFQGLAEACSKVIGARVPKLTREYVADYLGTMIEFVGDLYRLAGLPPVVNKPIQTLILCPDDINVVRMSR
jgi:hypothetical protein